MTRAQERHQRLLEDYAARKRKPGARVWTLPELWLVFDAALTVPTIARWLHIHPQNVQDEITRLRRAGFAVPDRVRTNRHDRPFSALAGRDAAIVAAIRDGEPHSALAIRYGVSHQRISQIWERDKDNDDA